MGQATKKHILIGFFILVGFILFSFSALFQDIFFGITTFLQSANLAHPLLGRLIFIGIAAAGVLLGPFSSAPIVPSAVYIWGTTQTLIYLSAGWYIGNIVAYLIGFYLGYPILQKFTDAKKLQEWESILKTQTTFWLGLIFRIATPSETGYIFGTLRYNFFKYLLITILAELPFALLTVYAGDAFVKNGWVSFVGFVLAWIVVIAIFARLLNKRVKNMRR